MPGGHKTHEYPKGKPLLLTVFDVLNLPVVVILGVFIIDSRCWFWLAPLAVLFAALTFVHRKLLEHYVSTGQAVPIPRSVVVVRYYHGTPTGIRALRLAFVADVAMMLIFGLAPFADRTAKVGVICLVLLLFGIAIAYIFVERHYVRKGIAGEVEVQVSGSPPKPD
jgi:predicted membrane protein